MQDLHIQMLRSRIGALQWFKVQVLGGAGECILFQPAVDESDCIAGIVQAPATHYFQKRLCPGQVVSITEVDLLDDFTMH